MFKRFTAIGLLAALALIALDRWSGSVSDRSTDRVAVTTVPEEVYARRVFQIASHRQGLPRGEIDQLIEQSDRIREQVEEDGEESLGDAVRRRLGAIGVSDSDAFAYYTAQRSLFGRRSFEASRHTIERLIRIDQVRAEFGL